MLGISYSSQHPNIQTFLNKQLIKFDIKDFCIAQAKKIDDLFSVTWSKTMCGMRNYLLIFYFGSKDGLKCAHVFILTNLRLYKCFPCL